MKFERLGDPMEEQGSDVGVKYKCEPGSGGPYHATSNASIIL